MMLLLAAKGRDGDVRKHLQAQKTRNTNGGLNTSAVDSMERKNLVVYTEGGVGGRETDRRIKKYLEQEWDLPTHHNQESHRIAYAFRCA